MENLELEFVLERERRYLEQNPSQATRLALNYLEDYLRLAEETKTLEQKLEKMIADNYVLKAQLIERSKTASIALPSFLGCHRH